VAQAAQDLGYVANSAARQMRSQRSHMVGLVIPDVLNAFYSTAAQAISQSFDEAGYQMVLCISEDKPEVEMRQVRSLAEARVDGIVWVPTLKPLPQTVTWLQSIAHAQLIRKCPLLKSDWFGIDDESTTIKAYKYTSSSSDNYVNYTPRSSVMLNIRYDLISTRKIKEKKIEPAKVAPVNNNTFVAPVSKPKIDYSKLSDEELKAAQKTATSNSDFDAIIGIQKELDKRQNEKEYESKSVEELKEMMKVSLEKEDYKKADLLQKIINKKEHK
jgi:hypothetical protein